MALPPPSRAGNQIAALWGQHLPRFLLLALVRRLWPVGSPWSRATTSRAHAGESA